MKQVKYQRGGAIMTLTIILMLAVPNLMLAYYILPPTMEHWKIESALSKLGEGGQKFAKIQDVRLAMSKHFRIEYVENFNLENIQGEPRDGKMVVTINYEKRVTFWRNVDLVMKFTAQNEVSTR
ncbi:MAG: DUF4845 domain-containing protein [Gammaproteobacteria bacterium]|nr:DUF4845 domain-containing protein [Gammaproteobacteria bacterium]